MVNQGASDGARDPDLTLKAFANSSPGLPLATLGKQRPIAEDANPEGVASLENVATPTELRQD
jgi:hypothetical protein